MVTGYGDREKAGNRNTGRWKFLHRSLVLTIAMLGLLGSAGCPEYRVIVDVPVPPKIMFDTNIKEYTVSEFEGPSECASDIKEGIDTAAKNSGYLVPAIPGLPDLDGPLEVKGKVSTCSMKMGYGAMNTAMVLWHGGRQLHQEVVKEETNRPGASVEEVRATLIQRTVDRFVKSFLPTKKPEVRELRPQGSHDLGWMAMREKNWRQAIETWSTRTKEDPSNHRAWYSRGVAHEANSQLPEAVADYKKAVELNPEELYLRMLSHAQKMKDASTIINTRK